MNVTVIKPGLFTTIQDVGRVGYESTGVPPSGFLDSLSANHCNTLLGNDIDAALLEITATGPSLRFEDDVVFAITGANMSPKLNNKSVKNSLAIRAVKGDVLSFGRLKQGYRSYLAFAGELSADEVYGSKSTNVLAGFGGFKGRVLQKGDVLTIDYREAETPRVSDVGDLSLPNSIIRMVPGPEMDWFTRQELSSFMTTDFVLSAESNRMGCRLEGDWIDEKDLKTIISSPNVSGVIQVTPSFQPIVLLNDAGTTGGYPRIGVCTKEGLNKLAQLKPGGVLGFSF